MELSSMYDDLPRDGEIVTICPGGGMSLVGAELLNKAGFVNAKSLKGGIWAWAEKGYPLVKGNGPIESQIEEIDSEETDYKQLSETVPSNQYSGKIDLVVDARNLFCPEPILKSRKAMRDLKEGQVLEILTTDPGSQKDIPAWTRANENELLVSEKLDPKGFRFLVRKTN
jgi:tRNA 2-thiouridine synthesizing protein A